MLEVGIWKMARQDCLHMPTSPALKAECEHLVTLVQDLEAAAKVTETSDNTDAGPTVDDTRAALQQVVDQIVDVAEATTTCPAEGHHARV